MDHTGLPYLWHNVPPFMRGHELWPLRALEAVDPEIAARQKAKYIGREHIAQLHVPILDCQWDEVIFLSPIHPQLLANSLQSVSARIHPMHVYQIPKCALLEHEVVTFNPLKSGPGGALTAESVSPWQEETYHSIPLSAHAEPYYKRVLANGREPLFLATEPHILVRGFTRSGKPHPINIAHATVIETIITPPAPSR